MSVKEISKEIKNSCQDDPVMEKLLIELLNYNLSSGDGKIWYKDKYKELIKKYAAEGIQNEN